MQPILLRGCSVRLVTPNDTSALPSGQAVLNGIASLLSQCFSLFYPAVYQGLCDRLSQSSHLCLIAVVGDTVVGVLELSIIHSNAIYLSNLAVDPNFRNQGIATKLLSFAQAIAFFLGVSNLCLHVLPVEKILLLYLRAGYQFHCVQSVANQTTILLYKKLHE